MDTKNKRKVTGAFVWHKNELKAITNQNVGKEHIVLNNVTKVKKSSVKLAKIGDAVKYKDLSVLPDRCATVSNMKITYFRANGIVGTDKDLYLRFNADSANNYSRTRLVGNGSTATSARQSDVSQIVCGAMPGTSYTREFAANE